MNLHGDERRHHLSPSMVGAEPSSDKPVTGADIYSFSAVSSTQKVG